jgi:hypothetical protein
MFSTTKTKINFSKILTLVFCTITITGLVLSTLVNSNLQSLNQSASAAAPNTGDLIIGKVDTGTAIEVSVCVKATDGPIRVTNVSLWLGFDNAALTTTPTVSTAGSVVPNGSLIEKGQYGNGNNGYSNMKWEQVQPAPVAPSTIDQYTLRLNFIGDANVAGSNGLLMNSTTPELYGKVRFNKVTGSTASTTISLNKNQFLSVENTTTPVIQTVTNVTTDCRGTNTTNTCTAGQYLVNNVCTVCAAGFYCPSGVGIQCPVNTYCPAGATATTACPSGQTSPVGSTSAAACVGSTNTCSAGQYLVNNVCTVCAAGFYCPSGVGIQCPVNTYCPAGATATTACPSSQTSLVGSTSSAACTTPSTVTTCPSGQYLTNNSCSACPASSSCAGGTAQPVFICISPNTLINNTCTPPTNNPLIGTSLATTTTPIGGSIGGQAPIIPLTGNTMPNGTVATFLPAGSTTSITGIIINSSFVPNAGQNIPSNASTGVNNGTLTANGLILSVPTNFSTATSTTNIGTPVATSTSPITGTAGSTTVPTISLINSTLPNNTNASLTLPGTATPIMGSIIGGVFTPTAGQTIPTGVTTGPAIATLIAGGVQVGIPINFVPAAGSVPTLGTTTITTTNPIGGAIGGQAPNIPLIGSNISNGATANFTPAGATTSISGTIINGSFIPNIGQNIPSGSTTGANTGILRVDTLTINIPTNFLASISSTNTNAGSGGVITICAGVCPQNTVTTTASSASSVNNTTSSSSITTTTTPAKNGVFKSKLRITDPYICGEGSYGNVTNPKQFGVDFVYYDFYKVGSTLPSYSYKLKIADNGDFFIPISPSTNVIAEGTYKIVFYVYDNEGNKAQGDYTDLVTDKCTNSNVIKSGTNGTVATVRSGGLEIFGILTTFSFVILAAILFKTNKTKKLNLKL